MRDDQHRFQPQPGHQLYGVLYAFALHDPGRLQHQQRVFFDLQIPAHIPAVLVRRLGRVLEIHYIGDQGGADPGAQS